MIYLEESLCGLFCPFVNVVFTASAAYSAITFFVASDVNVTFFAVVVEESLAWILAEKHAVYFFDLLWAEQILMGRFIFFPILVIF